MSTIIPFATRTEFVAFLRAGTSDVEADLAGVDFGRPEQVVKAILELVPIWRRTG